MIEAKEETWVRISDAEGALVFMRTMKAGETYRVPNRSGLLLDSGNAKGLAFQVDGNPTPAPLGMVRRGIELNPESLAQGVVARPRATAEAPSTDVQRLPAPVLAADQPVAEKPVVVKAEKPVEKPAPQKRVAEKPASETSGKLIAEPKEIVAAKKAASEKPAVNAMSAPLEPPPLEAPQSFPRRLPRRKPRRLCPRDAGRWTAVKSRSNRPRLRASC